MSTVPSFNLNGQAKKTLAFQLDRLDSILDGLAEALNDAVADAVRKTLYDAAREAVQLALKEALAAGSQQSCRNQASNTGFLLKGKNKLAPLCSLVRRFSGSFLQKLWRGSVRWAGLAVLALIAGVAILGSWGIRTVALTSKLMSCVGYRLPKDPRLLKWGVVMILCALLMPRQTVVRTVLLAGGACGLLEIADRSVNEQVAMAARPTKAVQLCP
jgi:hypothetical protein